MTLNPAVGYVRALVASPKTQLGAEASANPDDKVDTLTRGRGELLLRDLRAMMYR
jgi:hypothetical protein